MLRQILSEKEFFIFDMDGTITDTEPLHFAAYQRTLRDFFPDLLLTEEEFLTCYVGHPETEIYALLKQTHNISLQTMHFLSGVLSIYSALCVKRILPPRRFTGRFAVCFRIKSGLC